jgi:caffeoyl-CoA O-methyltransferase
MPTPAPWTPPDPLPLPLTTTRLRIDWLGPRHAHALHSAVSRDRDSLLPWLPWARTSHRTVDESRDFIEGTEAERRRAYAPEYAAGVFLREGDELLGGVGIHRIHHDAHEGEIGYWLRGDRRGRGYCTEATAAMISCAFRDFRLRRLRIHCGGDNAASRAVPERLGIRQEGHLRAAQWVEGIGWHDRAAYGVLASEWDVARDALLPSRERRGTAAKGFSATDPRIAPYVERLLLPEDPVLAEIRERSAAAGLPPIAVGPLDVRHLEVIARAAGARRIVEIGTLGGYSGTSLARALPEDGVLHTFELDPRHAEVARESFRRAGVLARVRIHVGRADDLLPTIEREGPFDLVFVDADKAGYPGYLAWAERNLRRGGVLLADNVFRRAAFPVPGDDPAAARGISLFNETLARSPAFRTTMLPLEDGLAMAVRT